MIYRVLTPGSGSSCRGHWYRSRVEFLRLRSDWNCGRSDVPQLRWSRPTRVTFLWGSSSSFLLLSFSVVLPCLVMSLGLYGEAGVSFSNLESG